MTRGSFFRPAALAAASALLGCAMPPPNGEKNGEPRAGGPTSTPEGREPSAPGEYWPEGDAVPRMEPVQVDCPSDDKPPEGKHLFECIELNAITDADGDGYYDDFYSDPVDEDDDYRMCFLCESGGKCICPPGYAGRNWSEPSHCDKYVPDDLNAQDQAQSIFHYGRLFREYDHGAGPHLGMRPIPPDPRFFWRIHPRQAETPFNGIDDDCDGWVDEAEPVYHPWPLNMATPNGFLVTLIINDKAVVEHADGVTMHAYKFRRLTWDDMRFSLQRGRMPADPPDCSMSFAYGGQLRPTFPFYSPCMEDDTPYAVLIKFRRGQNVIECVDAEGQPGFDDSLCLDDDGNTWRNRVFSEVFYQMTGTSNESRIVNQGFYELYLYERGLVGEFKRIDDLPETLHHQPFQTSFPGDVPYYTNKPDGTRYGCFYGEWWCSEFVAHLYGWDGIVHSGHLAARFMQEGTWLGPGSDFEGWAARFVLHVGQSVKPGTYLAMNTSTDKEGDMTHSGIVVDVCMTQACRSSQGGNTDMFNDSVVWRLHGNTRGSQIHLDTIRAYTMNTHGAYSVAGIGYL